MDAPHPDPELITATLGRDFSYAGRSFAAKVVSIYDGDTLRMVFRDRGELVQWSARMLGYDSPEMKPPKAKPNRDLEVAAAKAARSALASQVEGCVIYVRCGDFDKYGRILITAYRDLAAMDSVNDWMVTGGHGTPYDGGKKTGFVAPQ